MKRDEAMRVLGEHAADQWGLVTSAQASELGVDAVTLLRLGEAGLLEHVGRGVYRMAGAAPPEHLETKVAWLRLAPKLPAWKRNRPETHGGVVSHASACVLHDLGDIPSATVELSVPRRRTTRESGVRLRVRRVPPSEVAVVDGLPVTTPVRTVVDLLAARADGGHVGGVIADAERRGMLDLNELAERVRRFAPAYGLPHRSTGMELVDHLTAQAGAVLRAQEVARAEQRGFVTALSLVAKGPPPPHSELGGPLQTRAESVLARLPTPPVTAADPSWLNGLVESVRVYTGAAATLSDAMARVTGEFDALTRAASAAAGTPAPRPEHEGGPR